MVKKKIELKVVFKYLSLLLVFLCLSKAEIYKISPFLFAFYFACVFVGFDEKIVSGFLLFSSIVANPNLQTILTSISVVAVCLISFYLFRLFKRKLKLWWQVIFYLISLCVYIYYNYLDYVNLTCYISLGLVCLLAFIVVLQVLELRKNCFKMTLDETICFMFSLAVLGIGLASISFFEIEIYRIILCFCVLICVAIGNATLTYSIVLSLSFGVALTFGNLMPVAEFMILALVAGIFKQPNKWKILISVVLTDIFLQFFFINQNIDLKIIPIIISCVIFMLVPNKTILSLADLIYVKNSEISSRNLINITRHNIKKRMCELSNVFLEMKHLHLNMIKKELTKSELTQMLFREVVGGCCKDCLDKVKCTRSLGTENLSALQSLIETAVTKGKINLLDIPSGLSNRCGKINQLVTFINRICEEYKQYKSMLADVNNVKVLLADQMGAVSNLLLNLGSEIDTNVRFDVARENKIISRLLGQNVECKEVLLYAEKNQDLSAVLIVKTNNAFFPIIERVLSETLKVPMQITKVTPIDVGDYSSVTLRKKERFDCIFGLASVCKAGNNESGDCHSVIKLNQNKFLLALCDGMGSGKQANQISAMTLGLIENFYKAGFDNEIILESVNKLLAVSNQETYSTLDVSLIDLNNEIVDFVKIGSPFGLIKRKDKVEVVEGGSLPIGVLENVTPFTMKSSISPQDNVILFTDGIADAFKTKENLIDFVMKLTSNNPQTIADSILAEAVALNDMSPKDDMTVLVARTYRKN